jgi:hypothetical protein
LRTVNEMVVAWLTTGWDGEALGPKLIFTSW